MNQKQQFEVDFAPFHDDLAKSVLMKRYFHKDSDGDVIEGWHNMCWRVANAVASTEDERVREQYAMSFFNMMYDGDFLPNSPVLMNFGRPNALGSACFVLPIDDDMGSIFETLKNTALIHRDGGGTGFNFSRLRPFGARVKESGKSSGVVSFMGVYNAAGMVIEQGGKRRGANMGMLNCMAGDTEIDTVAGKVKIRELVGERPYVYACDPKTKSVHVVQADCVVKTDDNSELVRVWLDNDEHIDCTHDHRFMLSTGEYKGAGSLEIGDSLMAFHKKINKHGTSVRYVRTIGCTGGRSEYEHRVIARDIYCADLTNYLHVHHIDGDALNNDPSNIEIISRSEHAKKHDINLESNRVRLVAMRKGKRLEDIYGPKRGAEIRRKQSESRKKFLANHKVVSVERISLRGDVYDITVPKYHNFSANGVFVHNCDHPEIIKFIRCKEKDGELANFNISVAITDEFMRALTDGPATPHITYHESVGKCVLKNDGEWVPIVSRDPGYQYLTVKEVFDIIVEHAWKNGEPGVFFIDRANEKNPVPQLGRIETTNPCGEYAAIPYSSCNLGSINLSNMVKDGIIMWEELDETVRTAVRFLDNVIDVNEYPIPEIGMVTRGTRPIGLGVMGFADMLLKLGIRYGSIESVGIAEKVMSFIKTSAHQASGGLAEERGAYPECLNIGVRNCQVTTIAPTGTISILAGCSSGIEPVFSWGYERKAAGDTTAVKHPLIMMDELRDPGLLPKHFVTSKDINTGEHIEIQAAFQKYCDNGVSKTINLLNNATKEMVAGAIIMAWDSKCNGITIYRDGSRTGQVLSEKKSEPVELEMITIPEPLDEDVIIKRGEIVDRPRVTDGSTGRYRVGCGSLYITYNHLNGVPCEVFVNSSEGGGCAANSKALGMLISLGLRAGVDPDEVIRTLRKVSCPACRGKKGLDGKSCADVVARAMEEMTPRTGDFFDDFVPLKSTDISFHRADGCGEEVCLSLGVEVTSDPGARCPECGWEISHESGCIVCYQCGYSKCS